MAIMIAHTRDPVTPPSRIKPGIPADLEAVVLRCLAKNPNDRYTDTTRLAEAPAAWANADNWSPEHAAEWWRPTARRWRPPYDRLPIRGERATRKRPFPDRTESYPRRRSNQDSRFPSRRTGAEGRSHDVSLTHDMGLRHLAASRL
jgi:hypothetical protein